MATARSIGIYQLGDTLGKGGYGTVYKGLNTENGDFVAVKQISLKNVPKDQIASIQSEISLLKKLNHRHIVKYIDHKSTKEYLYIIIEYVENGSLASVVKKFGKIPEPLVALYISQVLEGLAYLHEEGVIHRDIKGANVLTTKDSIVKLADFGVAATLTEVDSESVVGTPYWMAPEIIELNPPSTASDIWSVGCTVIELLTGSPPYFDLAPMPALFRIVQDDHPPLPPDSSPALKDFLMQCFMKDPGRRKSAKKLLQHPWLAGVQKKFKESIETFKMMSDADKDIELTPRRRKKDKKPERKKEEKPKEEKPKNTAAILKQFAEEVEDETEEDWGDIKISSIKIDILKAPKDRSSGVLSSSPVPPISLLSKKAPAEAVGSSKPDTARKVPAAKSKFVEAEEEDDDWGDIGGQLEAKFAKGTLPKLSQNPTTAPPKIGRTISTIPSIFNTGGTSIGVLLPNNNEPKSKIDKFSENEEEERYDDLLEAKLFEDDLEDKVDADVVDFGKKLEQKRSMVWAANIDELMESTFDNIEEEDSFFQESVGQQKINDALTLISKLNPQMAEADILNSCQKLITILHDFPEAKGQIIAHHGTLPIMDMLDVQSTEALQAILQVVHKLIENNKQFQETLCLVGALPSIMKFADSKYNKNIRLETANIIHEFCATAAPRPNSSMMNIKQESSFITLQMFIACRGLPVVVEFLEHEDEQFEELRELLFVAVDILCLIFAIPDSRTPKNDFCRLFAKNNLLHHLSKLLVNLTKTTDPRAEEYLKKTIDTFILFSQGDSFVRIHLSHYDVMKKLVTLTPTLQPALKNAMINCIKNVSLDPNTLDNMQKAGVIPMLVSVLEINEGPFIMEMHSRALHALYNLCKIKRSRQDSAASAGLIPLLQRIIIQNSNIKQFALPMICDMAHASKRTRQELWKYDGVLFYMGLLKQEYWQVNALDSLAVWLTEETKKVQAIMKLPENIKRLIEVFKVDSYNTFVSMLPSIEKILKSSKEVNAALGASDFVAILVNHLKKNYPDALVRLNLLKILRLIYEFHPNPKLLITQHDLMGLVRNVVNNDKAVLVNEMASNLLNAFDANLKF